MTLAVNVSRPPVRVAPNQSAKEAMYMPIPMWLLVVIGVVVLALIVTVIASATRRRRRRSRFGPEYDRTREEKGRFGTTSELRGREKRRQELEIVELSGAARQRYTQQWQTVQTAFVDRPSDAVRDADGLVTTVMRERGYPIENFEQRSADVSVDHPNVVQNYRAAHAISLANGHARASTEDLRQAMVHYRALFEELLGDTDTRERRVS